MSGGEIKTVTPPVPPLSGGGATVRHSPSKDAHHKGPLGEQASLSLSPPDKGGTGGVRERRKYLPYDNRLTTLARQNRKNPTLAEHLIWTQVLSHRQFAKYKFHRQKPIGRYIADFYCPELKLVIEIDGDSHAAQADYDQKRTDYLHSLDLQVLRYANGDVQHNLSGIFDDLARVIAP